MTGTATVRHSPRGLVGLLCAQTLALTGTRMTMVALPWFALTLTGSAAATGLVAFAEMEPYWLATMLPAVRPEWRMNRATAPPAALERGASGCREPAGRVPGRPLA